MLCTMGSSQHKVFADQWSPAKPRQISGIWSATKANYSLRENLLVTIENIIYKYKQCLAICGNSSGAARIPPTISGISMRLHIDTDSSIAPESSANTHCAYSLHSKLVRKINVNKQKNQIEAFTCFRYISK